MPRVPTNIHLELFPLELFAFAKGTEGSNLAASRGRDLSAIDHIPDGKVAERHRRRGRQAGLVADTVFGRGGNVARGMETWNAVTPVMDRLSCASRSTWVFDTSCPHRNRKFADSLLEEAGFEPSVPAPWPSITHVPKFVFLQR